MPGISLYYSKNKIDAKLEKRLVQINESLAHFPAYECRSLFNGKFLQLFYCGHQGHTLSIYKSGRYQIFINGRIYGRSEAEFKEDLNYIITKAFAEDMQFPDLAQKIDSKLALIDSEYNLVAIDKMTENFLLFNDSFGKLLLFYFKNNTELLVSHEVKFIQKFLETTEFDKYAVAEFLSLKHTIGHKSLLRKIRRFPHAAFICSSKGFDNFEINAYKNWDLSEDDFGKPATYHSKRLVEMFLEATRLREKSGIGGKALIGLSGGLDSRAVLCALEFTDSDITAASSISYNLANEYDVGVAGKIAGLYNSRWLKIYLKQTRFEDYLNLIDMRDGLNPADMAVAMGLYRYLLNMFDYGTNFYTGDGGVHIKIDYRLTDKIKSVDNLVYHVLLRQARFTKEDLEGLLGIKWDEFRNYVVSVLKDYPGLSLGDKYYYYLVFDQRRSMFFEGEERTRDFFWTCTPYESQPFYSLALQIPDREKSEFRLFRLFLKDLDPRLLDIEYADLRCPITSKKALWKMKVKAFLQDHIKLINTARKILEPKIYGPFNPPQFHSEMVKFVESSELLPEIFDIKYLLKMISERINSAQYMSLLTIILYCRLLEKPARPNW